METANGSEGGSWFNHAVGVVRIRFAGTHEEYDRIDARTIMTTLSPVRPPEDHQAALRRIDQLMEAGEGSPEAAELEVLAILVERYERDAFPIEAASPIDTIRFRVKQMGYSQASPDNTES